MPNEQSTYGGSNMVFMEPSFCNDFIGMTYSLMGCINPLPHLTILGSSSSAANKDMMAKIRTYEDTINCF